MNRWKLNWVLVYYSTFENLKLIEDTRERWDIIETILQYWYNGVDDSDFLSKEWKIIFNSAKSYIDNNVRKFNINIDDDEEYNDWDFNF